MAGVAVAEKGDTASRATRTKGGTTWRTTCDAPALVGVDQRESPTRTEKTRHAQRLDPAGHERRAQELTSDCAPPTLILSSDGETFASGPPTACAQHEHLVRRVRGQVEMHSSESRARTASSCRSQESLPSSLFPQPTISVAMPPPPHP